MLGKYHEIQCKCGSGQTVCGLQVLEFDIGSIWPNGNDLESKSEFMISFRLKKRFKWKFVIGPRRVVVYRKGHVIISIGFMRSRNPLNDRLRSARHYHSFILLNSNSSIVSTNHQTDGMIHSYRMLCDQRNFLKIYITLRILLYFFRNGSRSMRSFAVYDENSMGTGFDRCCCGKIDQLLKEVRKENFSVEISRICPLGRSFDSKWSIRNADTQSSIRNDCI